MPVEKEEIKRRRAPLDRPCSGKSIGPVAAPAGPDSHLAVVDENRNTIAIPFDLVHPFRPGGCPQDERRETWLYPIGDRKVKERGLARVYGVADERPTHGFGRGDICSLDRPARLLKGAAAPSVRRIEFDLS
ncbi:hypothetical protein CHELA20_40276 [Hyphomicrobiales bacterium]|nr:hypothetical protein CHELA20_40276 [Hyphomicrobiales bacterium]CAH1687993.1 hypothetical protein CHELA41_40132 [Hyphomicrobiales bacterium]